MLEKSLFILVFALLFMGLAVWSQHVKTSPDVAYASVVPERTFNNSAQEPLLGCPGSKSLPLEIEAIQSPTQSSQ